MILRPVTSEKAVKLLDTENTILFEVSRTENKASITKEVETLFTVKVARIRTHIKANKKYAYVKLVAANPAVDIAAKVGMI